MQITNIKQLRFFIKADRMINRGYFDLPIKVRIKSFFVKDNILDYLYYMRCYSYSLHGCDFKKRFGVLLGGAINSLAKLYYGYRFHKLGLKLGFSIGPDVFDYGLRLTHYGTMVIGTNNTIGKFALIQPSTCIEGQGDKIGDNFYLSTGAKVVKKITIADNVIIGANAVLNKTIITPNVMVAGIPAIVKGAWKPWWQGTEEEIKVDKIEQLKKTYGYNDA